MPSVATRVLLAAALATGGVLANASDALAQLRVARFADLTRATGGLPTGAFADNTPSLTTAPDGRAWVAWVRSEIPGGEITYTVFLATTDASLALDPASLEALRWGPRPVRGVAVSTDGASPIVYTALGADLGGGPLRGTVVVSRGLTGSTPLEPVPGPGVLPLVEDGIGTIDVMASQRVPPGVIEYAFIATRTDASLLTAAVTVIGRVDRMFTTVMADATFRIPNATQVRIAHARTGTQSMAVAMFPGSHIESYVPDGGARVTVPMSASLWPPGLAAHPARSFVVTIGPRIMMGPGAPLACVSRDEDAVFELTPDCAAATGFGQSNTDLATATDEGAGGTIWASAATCPTSRPAGPGGVIVASPGTGEAPLVVVERGFECCSHSSIAPLGADSALVAASCGPAGSPGLDATHVLAWVVTRTRAVRDGGVDSGADAVEPADVVATLDGEGSDAMDTTPDDASALDAGSLDATQDDTAVVTRPVVRVRGGACMCRAVGPSAPSREGAYATLALAGFALVARRRRGGAR